MNGSAYNQHCREKVKKKMCGMYYMCTLVKLWSVEQTGCVKKRLLAQSGCNWQRCDHVMQITCRLIWLEGRGGVNLRNVSFVGQAPSWQKSPSRWYVQTCNGCIWENSLGGGVWGQMVSTWLETWRHKEREIWQFLDLVINKSKQAWHPYPVLRCLIMSRVFIS